MEVSSEKLGQVPRNPLAREPGAGSDLHCADLGPPEQLEFVQAGRATAEGLSVKCVSFLHEACREMILNSEDDDFLVCVGRQILVCGFAANNREYAFKPKAVFTDESPTEKFMTAVFMLISEALTIAAGGRDGVVKLFSLTDVTKKWGLMGHRNTVREVKAVGMGDFLVSCGDDLSARLWNARTMVQIAVFQGALAHTDSIRCLDVHHSQRFLITGSLDRCLQLWSFSDQIVHSQASSSALPTPRLDLPNLRLQSKPRSPTQLITHPFFFTYKVHTAGVCAVRFYFDLVVSQDQSNTVCVWQANPTRSECSVVLLHKYEVQADVWSRFGLDEARGLLAVAGQLGEVWVWHLMDLGEKPTKVEVPHVRVRGCAFGKDGRTLVAYCKDSYVLKLQPPFLH